METDPYRVLQSLLPGISRLEAKSLCHQASYGPVHYKGVIISLSKTVSPNATTPALTSTLPSTPMPGSSVSKETNK